jgi:lipopolysaccharide/colanic/teichoic acid biosynthesis glycosyltransferase
VSTTSLRAKRALDLALATPLLLLAAPAMLAIALLLRCCDGAPVLFRQSRPGRGGRTFVLLKFRTMRPGSGADAERLTRLGRLLRGLSLDELPQLWNVVRGDMSLVGPRPLLPQYLTRYSARQMRRHEVPPGITGLAQVEGRNALSWDERFELDVWYVDHRSLALDLQLVVRTVWAVACRRGVSARDHATMPEFLGSAASADVRPALALRTE